MQKGLLGGLDARLKSDHTDEMAETLHSCKVRRPFAENTALLPFHR